MKMIAIKKLLLYNAIMIFLVFGCAKKPIDKSKYHVNLLGNVFLDDSLKLEINDDDLKRRYYIGDFIFCYWNMNVGDTSCYIIPGDRIDLDVLRNIRKLPKGKFQFLIKEIYCLPYVVDSSREEVLRMNDIIFQEEKMN